MVYVIAELRNYRQLARLRSGSLPEVEAGLEAALGTRAAQFAAAGNGVWMAELGAEGDLDAAAAVTVARRVRDFLASRREGLFGFGVLLAAFAPGTEAAAGPRIRRIMEEAPADEQLWITPECAPLFAGVVPLSRSGALLQVTGQSHAAPAVEEQSAARRWGRESLIARALDFTTARLNNDESREILFVHGPPGVGKTALLQEVASRLVRAHKVPVLRARTIFKRRSSVHPFLSSLSPELLSTVPRWLRGPELAVWQDVGGLLGWLQDRPAAETPGTSTPLPDHVREDFSLAYRLYLLAWARLAEQSLLPAVLLCEGIDAWHPSARRILSRLLDDLLARPSFLPLLSAGTPDVPEELSGLALRPLYVHPLGKREIRSLAQHVHPGLEIPEAIARRLRRRSGGQYVAVVSYLHFLLKIGAITAENGRHRWARAPDDEAALPANPLSVSWYLIRSLHDDTFLLLYALYLSAGLLDRQEVLAFLSKAGFDAAVAARAIESLLAAGLVEEEGTLIPRFPALRRKLEELLGAEGAGLRDRFVSHIFSLWTEGRYRHPVLLFTFLARGGRTELALRVLPDIIRRKLDENDPAGARAFCEPKALEFSVPPTTEQARMLSGFTSLGRLRAALMEEDGDTADAAHAETLKNAGSDGRGVPRAEASTERAKYFLFSGQALAALDELKEGLLLFQEHREALPVTAEAGPGERACYLWLGAAMLAEGRLGEAVEYLSLSQRLCHEAADSPGSLWTIVYLADCLFIDGRYTRCFSVIEQGIELARRVYRRELELYFLFLKARALFQIGSYDDCSLCLQGCLGTATLYSVEASLPVLRAWLGRTLLHQGELTSGTRLLESIAQTREVLLFEAEGSLFSGGLENASLYVERGLAQEVSLRFPPPEGISWHDGFSGVEGRCFRLGRGDALVQRTLFALRAYLQGLRGFPDRGIRELHQLTRGEKAADEDPAAFWFNYLYAMVLPEAGTEDVDDKVTILGKSLKSLQERASRIDAPAQRSSYLWRSRWNRMIMEEARERKLV